MGIRSLLGVGNGEAVITKFEQWLMRVMVSAMQTAKPSAHESDFCFCDEPLHLSSVCCLKKKTVCELF